MRRPATHLAAADLLLDPKADDDADTISDADFDADATFLPTSFDFLTSTPAW